MNVVHTVGLIAQSAVTYMKRVALRHHLLGLDDVLLEDIGVSRELLAQGVKAYPWHIETKDKDSDFVTFNVKQPLVVMSQPNMVTVKTSAQAANEVVADTKSLPQAA